MVFHKIKIDVIYFRILLINYHTSIIILNQPFIFSEPIIIYLFILYLRENVLFLTNIILSLEHKDK